MAPLLFAAALAANPAGAEAAVNRLLDDFIAAERAYDPAALARLVTPDYVEVSPLGEVDAHDRFLGFYAPANRKDAPPLTIDERQLRVTGNSAIAIVRLSYSVPGRPQPLAVRATFIARLTGTTWQMAGSQFTGIRSPSPPPPANP